MLKKEINLLLQRNYNRRSVCQITWADCPRMMVGCVQNITRLMVDEFSVTKIFSGQTDNFPHSHYGYLITLYS